MFDCKMVINKLNINDGAMEIDVAISCPFDVEVTSPKAKIIFECDGHTRRLPLRVVNYFRQKQEGSCIIVCNYTFFLDTIFYDFEPISPITVKIDFYYGEHVVKGAPFLVSTNIIDEYPVLDLGEEYIEYECFNCAHTPEGLEKEFENTKRNKESEYTLSFDCENNAILLIPTTGKPHRSFVERSRFLIPLVKFFSFVIRIAISLLLAPYFVFDGILAGLKIVPKRNTAPIHGTARNIFLQIKINFSSFIKTSFKRSNFSENIRRPLFSLLGIYYKKLCKKDVAKNRITFMSGRRDILSGNMEFVYNLIKDNSDIDFQFLLFSDANGHYKLKNILRFIRLYASSQVVVVDDYFRLLNIVKKRRDVKLVQLWHACGAFKTFGFTRLGKAGGPKQTDPNHRMYDVAIVSSGEIAKHYAEGFGLSDEKIVATGIPRTDIFMDTAYANKVKAAFYEKYPHLKEKKIILFAPTFRGNGQMSAYYPSEVFGAKDFYEALGGDYAVLIKYHPFCKERPHIPEIYKDVIIDLSDEDELNDLLFVSDVLITDYSSVIFEASLLNIPMLFYAFDLFDYISSRDFYYDFEAFVPGKIVFSQQELIDAVINEDYDNEKIGSFKEKFFDHLDGKSSCRVADMLLGFLSK